MDQTVYRSTESDAAQLLTELTGLQHRFLQSGVNPQLVIETVRSLRLRPTPFRVRAYYAGKWDHLWATTRGFVVKRGNEFELHTALGLEGRTTTEALGGYRGFEKHPLGMLVANSRGLMLQTFAYECLQLLGILDQPLMTGDYRGAVAHPSGALIYQEFENQLGRQTRVLLSSWGDGPPDKAQTVTVSTLIEPLPALNRIFPCRQGVVRLKHDGGWEYDREFVLHTPTGEFPLFKGVAYKYLIHPEGVIVQTEKEGVLLCTLDGQQPLRYTAEWQGIERSNGGEDIWGLAHPQGVVLRHGQQLLLHTTYDPQVLFQGEPFTDSCVNSRGQVFIRCPGNRIVQCEAGKSPRLVSDIPHYIVFGPHELGAFMVDNGRAFICSPKD